MPRIRDTPFETAIGLGAAQIVEEVLGAHAINAEVLFDGARSKATATGRSQPLTMDSSLGLT